MLSPLVNTKTSWEELKINFNFENYLEAAETVTSVDTLSVLTGTAVAGAPVIATPRVQALYTGGVDREDCVVRCRVNTSNGQKKEIKGRLEIRD